jgi:fused signal recognition particle receptor
MDTAGRMQTSKNLMDEMGKIVRVVKPDIKLFIGDALAGNDTINQAREFFQYTNFDGGILTKVDADAKGGSAISIAHITSKPVVYIGVGQSYDDIIPFDPDKFIGSLFGSVGEVSVENLMSIPKASELTIEKTKSEETQEVKEKEEEEEEEEELLLLPKPPVQPSSRSVSIFAPKAEQKAEAHAPKPIVHQLDPSKVEEQPKEKKGRFGFFGKKKTDEDHRSKEEEEEKDKKEKRKLEEKRAREEEEEEWLTKDKENQKEERKREEDKDSKEQQEEEKDKLIYLTDEDIEDLLK